MRTSASIQYPMSRRPASFLGVSVPVPPPSLPSGPPLPPPLQTGVPQFRLPEVVHAGFGSLPPSSEVAFLSSTCRNSGSRNEEDAWESSWLVLKRRPVTSTRL